MNFGTCGIKGSWKKRRWFQSNRRARAETLGAGGDMSSVWPRNRSPWGWCQTQAGEGRAEITKGSSGPGQAYGSPWTGFSKALTSESYYKKMNCFEGRPSRVEGRRPVRRLTKVRAKLWLGKELAAMEVERNTSVQGNVWKCNAQKWKWVIVK